MQELDPEIVRLLEKLDSYESDKQAEPESKTELESKPKWVKVYKKGYFKYTRVR